MTKQSKHESGFSIINSRALKNPNKVKTNLLYSIHIGITQEMKDFLVAECERQDIDRGEFLRKMIMEKKHSLEGF